jgi:glycine cleavage system H protein
VIPDDLFYTRDHVWLRPGEDYFEVGVTEPLVARIAPMVSIELLDADDDMKFELPFAQLEGHAETRHLYPPVETRIVDVNDELLWDQSKLEKDPYGEGWLIRIVPADTQELLHLMTAHPYQEFCAEDLDEE